tara:strand:+ start:4639 stop:5619 length:981 start_codon:yes stop_codon:yes gene_type:complete
MKEEDIRPQHIFDEYLALTIQDTKTYFGHCERESIQCPACGAKGEFSFNKSGFDYEECKECYTLFVNPRPVASSFDKYYTEAPSAEYWATTFYKKTAEARRELLWKPKAKLVKRIIDKWLVDKDYSVVDIGGGYGIFSEEIEDLTKKKSIVIEPGPRLAQICRDKNLIVIEKFLETVNKSDLPHGRKVFVSFELFEHLHSPELFMKSLHNVMEAGDLFIFTTLSGTGVDIRTLWNHSKSVSPPHHLNFLNPKSIPILLERVGLSSLEISTPGKLDIDIMINGLTNIEDKFWKSFLELASEEDKRSMQKTIQDTCSSSHIMVVSKKK